MEKMLGNNTFQAVPNPNEDARLTRKAYEWLPKYQIIVSIVFIFQCMYFASITEGWKGYLANLAAIVALYFIISGIFNEIRMHIESRDKEIFNLRRQLSGFICDASLGRVSEVDLNRIAAAANDISWLETKQDDLSKDDFGLISRAWFFWKDQNGFEWQDKTECISCGMARKEHSRDGSCPSSKK